MTFQKPVAIQECVGIAYNILRLSSSILELLLQ